MSEEKSELNTAFTEMLDNPDFDWGFEKEREATEFANFGVTAEKAAEIRKQYEDLEDESFEYPDEVIDSPLEPEAVDSFHAQFERFDAPNIADEYKSFDMFDEYEEDSYDEGYATGYSDCKNDIDRATFADDFEDSNFKDGYNDGYDEAVEM